VFLDQRKVWARLGWNPHRAQRAVLESDARHRVVSAGRRFGKSAIGGHELVLAALLTPDHLGELRRTGKRREYWVVGPEYCVDEETESLTQRGWLKYNQLRVGDYALGQNPETGLAEWTPIEKVNVFPRRRRKMIHSVFRGHDSMSTPDHRWLVHWGKIGVEYSTNTGVGRRGCGLGERTGYDFVNSSELRKANERVYGALPVTNLPIEPKYTDALVELVAWYWTEGSQWGHGLSISQNAGLNLVRIEAACQALLGTASPHMRYGSVVEEIPRWRRITKNSTGVQGGVALNAAAAAEMFAVCVGKEKVVTPEFLSSLTRAQLELFIRVSVLADADSDWDGESVEMGQNSEARSDMFQMACQLAGYRTTRTIKHNEYGPWYVVSVYRQTKGACWYGATYAKSAKEVIYDGIIWCPSTGTGTWLARRNGRVFFTGNSDAEKEFRVLWNALEFLGLPFDRPGSYYHADSGNLHLSLWRGKFQVHGKSARHPETLVGEGLDGVIMAEAAKLKQIVWTKYIRPTLADTGGWSLHCSTPEGKNWFYENWQRGIDSNNLDWAAWRCPSWLNPYVYRERTSDEDVALLLELLENPQRRLTEVGRLTEVEFSAASKVTERGLRGLADAYGLRIDDEILSLISDLTNEAFLQEIGADFTEFVGRVFKGFDEETHVFDLEYQEGWETCAAVDYGFTNPAVWLLVQIGPWGEVRVLGEVHESGLTIPEFAAQIRARGLDRGVCTFYPDPADPGASRQLEAELGVRSVGGTGGELKWRIEAIRKALVREPTHLPDDHPEKLPRLRIDRSCVRTIYEMQSYRYPGRRESVRGDEAAELPMKKDDHAPEALGRFFAGRFGTPAQVNSGRAARARVVAGRRER
jgi:hypothetical protein